MILFLSLTGFYLGFTGANKLRGAFGRVSSSSITGWFPRCVRFKYRICPAYSGKLKVLTQTKFGSTFLMRTEVWSRRLSNCSGWTTGLADVPSTTHDFSIAFEAELSSTEGNIGIDDITMFEGNCF